MKTYIGTKVLKAKPMTRGEYNIYRCWTIPADEDQNEAGYLVEYDDSKHKNHDKHTGYISWSPAEIFEAAYQPMNGMTFGMAIEAMRIGLKVARSGWNGKNMWICLSPGAKGLNEDGFWAKPNAEYASEMPYGVDVNPCITMKTADGSIVMGWLASQTDMLADDWELIK